MWFSAVGGLGGYVILAIMASDELTCPHYFVFMADVVSQRFWVPGSCRIGCGFSWVVPILSCIWGTVLFVPHSQW